MKRISLIFFSFLFSLYVSSQSVGIGTPTPHDKAILDISSNNKGVLFPRMKTEERDDIINPPNGLHIFNTDDRSLNYYDSAYGIWNCYLDNCKTEIILISSGACKLDFYNAYAKNKPANRYLVIIQAGIAITGCVASDTALSFANMPVNVTVTIRNYGIIDGAGGRGGSGRIQNNAFPSPCFTFPFSGSNGGPGGHAIGTKTGVFISVTNYGIVAGGGGGGGSGGSASGTQYGGGGGGGAGNVPGNGGTAGVILTNSGFPVFSCVTTVQSNPGLPGTATNGGIGGVGSAGGGTGGTGGLRGQPGSPGSDNAFIGGPAGKAIAGGSGNSLINLGSGQSFGVVD